MNEFTQEPVVFLNETDSSYDVGAGIIFRKSGVYDVTITGNKTIVSKVSERKKGKWIFPYETTKMVSICSECGAHGRGNFCSNCGARMEGEQDWMATETETDITLPRK